MPWVPHSTGRGIGPPSQGKKGVIDQGGSQSTQTAACATAADQVLAPNCVPWRRLRGGPANPLPAVASVLSCEERGRRIDETNPPVSHAQPELAPLASQHLPVATEVRSSSVSGSSSSGAARIASSTGSANARRILRARRHIALRNVVPKMCNSWRSISAVELLFRVYSRSAAAVSNPEAGAH